MNNATYRRLADSDLSLAEVALIKGHGEELAEGLYCKKAEVFLFIDASCQEHWYEDCGPAFAIRLGRAHQLYDRCVRTSEVKASHVFLADLVEIASLEHNRTDLVNRYGELKANDMIAKVMHGY